MSMKTRRHRHSGHTSNGKLRADLVEINAQTGPEDSAQESFRLIQMRAYDLWEQAGRPGGDAVREHLWYRAESEILASQATND
jgi:DUF2934 family protein